MDIRELPRILFREFAFATLEATDDRWVGETAEGAGLVLRTDGGTYGNAILKLYWRSERLDERMTPLLEIEAGLRSDGMCSGTVARLGEGAWVRYPISPIEWACDLKQPRVALIGRLIKRASELVRSGGFELDSVLYDWQRGERLEPPLPAI